MTLEIIIQIIIGVILVIGAICFALNEKKTVKEWLFLAVTEAEKALGSKMGRMKLAQVFNEFIKAFPIFSKFIKVGTFTKWVDLALEQMREYLQSNKNAKDYVGFTEQNKD